MVQRLMDGPEFSIDCLSDLDGRCLNAIPRTMIESRGGESIKGTVIADPELIELGRRVVEALGVRGPCTVQVFRDSEIGLGITDVNTRFGGAFPAPMYAALPGRTYPELIVRMARGEQIEPHVGEFRAGVTLHPLLLAARARRAAAADRPRHRRAARPAAAEVLGPVRRQPPRQPRAAVGGRLAAAVEVSDTRRSARAGRGRSRDTSPSSCPGRPSRRLRTRALPRLEARPAAHQRRL